LSELHERRYPLIRGVSLHRAGRNRKVTPGVMTGSEKEKLLDRIREPKDLRRLTYEEIDQLCAEIRELIIETTSITGG